RVMRDLMALLDDQVGRGRWVLALTADHGVCPLPEATRTQGGKGRRVAPKPFLEAAEEHLDRLFPPRKGEKKGKGGWIEIIPYDTHVPLVVLGPGVRPGSRTERVSPELTAVALTRALGVKPPARAAAAVPPGLFAGGR